MRKAGKRVQREIMAITRRGSGSEGREFYREILARMMNVRMVTAAVESHWKARKKGKNKD